VEHFQYTNYSCFWIDRSLFFKQIGTDIFNCLVSGEGLSVDILRLSRDFFRFRFGETFIDLPMAEKIKIEGREIAIKSVNDQDYISLTDIAKGQNAERPDLIISNWLRNRNTLEFLGLWEGQNNKDFNPKEFEGFINKSGSNGFALSSSQWIKRVNAVGIVSKAGRYGGTFAHVDIAFSFGAWISATFQYRLIKEFQHLRSEEVQRQRIEWSVGRELARLNYPIQTAAIHEVTGSLSEKKKPGVYANEANLINELVFGMTAKQWRAHNPDTKGNIRDNASTLQNVLIANLENLNAYLIKNGASYEARRKVLAKTVSDHTDILSQKYLPE